MLKILKLDPGLKPYKKELEKRAALYAAKREELTDGSLSDFACGHQYFGIHPTKSGWVYREWAPAADEMYLTGDFCDWELFAHPMKKLPGGVFELKLRGKNALQIGQKIQVIIKHRGELLRRIPTYATRVVQDPETFSWCCQVDDTLWDGFPWTDAGFRPAKTPYIYECHIGMAQEKCAVGTYAEFTKNTLPHIKKLGYNTIQLMAVMEHPYYGSFGYQVTNFFAVSSRCGTGRDLKQLINTAHEMGLAVLLDVVHSHAAKNTEEGIARFDGTEYQFFHRGLKGNHREWDTKLFHYGKNQVLHFLLSNLKFWMEVYHFDGFRFDGVTSMLYHDHGLGSAFTDYGQYFSLNTDLEAVTYLALANRLIHEINPHAITVAEDMSGMPGMCLPIKDGGIGFDFRLSMGVPDLWISLIREYRDEDWPMGKLWYELTTRRPGEKNIGYCESHDQALVGDKTLLFRLCDEKMYTHMSKFTPSPVIDRGIALHKMIRLITATLAGEGYLNFMGNEFGHPEWIDFPREGNGWSHYYCRRQWSLANTSHLRYGELLSFDKEMLSFLRRSRALCKPPTLQKIHEKQKVLIYQKGKYLFLFNFHPTASYKNCFVPVTEGRYAVVLTTDDAAFGGFDRVDKHCTYTAKTFSCGRTGFFCYLPARTAIVLRQL